MLLSSKFENEFKLKETDFTSDKVFNHALDSIFKSKLPVCKLILGITSWLKLKQWCFNTDCGFNDTLSYPKYAENIKITRDTDGSTMFLTEFGKKYDITNTASGKRIKEDYLKLLDNCYSRKYHDYYVRNVANLKDYGIYNVVNHNGFGEYKMLPKGVLCDLACRLYDLGDCARAFA